MVFQRPQGYLDVIEGNRVIPELLMLLVTFAGDQYNIPRARQSDRSIDGFAPVDDRLKISSFETRHYIMDDRLGVFLAWVV